MTASSSLPQEPIAIHDSGVRFLRKQDGKPERPLKAQLVLSFKRHDEVLKRAILL